MYYTVVGESRVKVLQVFSLEVHQTRNIFIDTTSTQYLNYFKARQIKQVHFYLLSKIGNGDSPNFSDWDNILSTGLIYLQITLSYRDISDVYLIRKLFYY